MGVADGRDWQGWIESEARGGDGGQARGAQAEGASL